MAPCSRFSIALQGPEMKMLAATIAILGMTGTASAETQDCKTLTDPAARLTCYDKINPPVASYPIPLPKPAHSIPLTRPDGTTGSAEVSESGDDALVNAKMNGICRGC
jgi:hypothetical protein